MTKPPTETLGEKVRKIADQLKEESDLQIKVTSRILGAAAQIAENHDRLIDEVANMVEEDLDLKNNGHPINAYTVESLKKQFKTLGEAKSHFGLKATSWASLINKLNNSSIQNKTSTEQIKPSIPDRLETIENEIKILREHTNQILVLLKQLISDKK
jgi:hypothetical protein